VVKSCDSSVDDVVGRWTRRSLAVVAAFVRPARARDSRFVAGTACRRPRRKACQTRSVGSSTRAPVLALGRSRDRSHWTIRVWRAAVVRTLRSCSTPPSPLSGADWWTGTGQVVLYAQRVSDHCRQCWIGLTSCRYRTPVPSHLLSHRRTPKKIIKKISKYGYDNGWIVLDDCSETK